MSSAHVNAYWEYQRLSAGDRSQRLASADLFWAVDRLMDLIASDPLDALALLIELAEAAPDDMGLVLLGTGPLEDLLAAPTEEVVEAVDVVCRRDPRLRTALSHATITADAAASLRRFQ